MIEVYTSIKDNNRDIDLNSELLNNYSETLSIYDHIYDPDNKLMNLIKNTKLSNGKTIEDTIKNIDSENNIKDIIEEIGYQLSQQYGIEEINGKMSFLFKRISGIELDFNKNIDYETEIIKQINRELSIKQIKSNIIQHIDKTTNLLDNMLSEDNLKQMENIYGDNFKNELFNNLLSMTRRITDLYDHVKETQGLQSKKIDERIEELNNKIDKIKNDFTIDR